MSIDAAMDMRLMFAQDDRAEDRPVLPLFNAPLELLIGREHRHQRHHGFTTITASACWRPTQRAELRYRLACSDGDRTARIPIGHRTGPPPRQPLSRCDVARHPR